MKPKFNIGQEVWLVGDGQPRKELLIGIRLDIKEYHQIEKAKFKYLTTCYGREYDEKEIYSTRKELFKYLNDRADFLEDQFRVKYIYGNKNGRNQKITKLLGSEADNESDGDTGEVE